MTITPSLVAGGWEVHCIPRLGKVKLIHRFSKLELASWKRTTWLSLMGRSVWRQGTLDYTALGLLMQCSIHTDAFSSKTPGGRNPGIHRISSLDISVKARFSPPTLPLIPHGFAFRDLLMSLLLSRFFRSTLSIRTMKGKKKEKIKLGNHSKWRKNLLDLTAEIP